MPDAVIVNRMPESLGMRLERENLGLPEPTIGSPDRAVQEYIPVPFVTARPNPGAVEDGGTRFTQEEINSAKTEFHVPPHVGETVVLQPHQTAISQRDSQTGKIELEPDQDPIDVAAAEKANQMSLAEQLRSIGFYDQSEFLKFKTQVIATFKHLGIDVRKHFGV
jgi:hypothetical protein